MPVSAAVSQARLSPDDLRQLKWLLGQSLALVSIWALWSLNSVSGPLLALFTLAIVVVSVWPGLLARVPAWLAKAATPALLIIIAVDFALHGANFLDPMIRMVGLLTLYRALQYRSRREDLQLLLLSLFTLVITGVLLVSLAFAAQMLVFTPLAMGLLFLVNLLDNGHDRVLQGGDWKGFAWRRFATRLRHGMDFRFIGFSGVIFLVVVMISTAIFVSLPRIQMDQALPFLRLQSSGGIGFSDTIRYGDVSDLIEGDDRVVLQVDASDPAAMPARPYWRMVVLDHYDPIDSTFRVSNGARQFTSRRVDEGFRHQNSGMIPDGEPDMESMNFYLEGDVSSYLPLLGPFESLTFSRRMKFFPNPEFNVMELEATSASTIGYSARGVWLGEELRTSRREQRELDALLGHPIPLAGPTRAIEYPETTLLVPVETEDREFLQAAVREITGGEPLDARSFAERASRWLSEHYYYSLSTGLPRSELGEDHLITWMRKARSGWCEHFAGSFILLAREAGFPARVVAGFAGATWNEYEDYFVVRSRMAHAWAEIYDGKGAWVRVDPTPAAGGLSRGQANDALAGAMVTESGWAAWFDSLRMVWYRRVVSFDQADQQEIANNIRDLSVSAVDRAKARITAWWREFKAWLTEGWDTRKAFGIGARVMGVVVGLLALRLLVAWWRDRRRQRSQGRGRMAADPVRRHAGKVLARFRPAYQRARGHLDGDALVPWQEAYEALIALRFGANPDPRLLKRARRTARRLLR